MPSRHSSGQFVHQCPGCSSRELRVIGYECLACKEDFPAPTRQTFRTQADALRAHGMCMINVRKRPKEFFVDICPKCGSTALVEDGFACGCGRTFSRWDAVLLWEVEVDNKPARGKRADDGS